MSSLLGGGQGLAGLARVSFEATGVGEVTRDINLVEREYRQSSEGMSDSAIKVELAQQRLQRTLRKGPSAYREQASAELQLRRAERELRDETVKLDHAQDRAQAGLGRFGRGALAGSGAFRSLGRSVAFASAGFLGGAGLVAGMTKAISIASNLEEQQNATRVVFKESADTVLDWSRTTATSIGIARDQALEYAGSIGGIANASGLARDESADLSKSIVNLASDLASAKNEDPSEMLEALRSGLVGEAEPLRRRGVLLSAAAVSQEAFRLGLAKTTAELTEGDKVQARYSIILKQTADIQGDYANTQDGLANSQRTLSALWREAEGIIGQALLPSVTGVTQGLRDWLAEDKNRESLQRNVNTLVKDGAIVAHDLADAIEAIADKTRPVVGALGGMAKTIELLGLAFVAWKLRGLASFGATALASKRTSVSMVADATLAGRAWDIATRPRNMIVTTTTTGAPGAPGIPSAPGVPRAPGLPRPTPRVLPSGIAGLAVLIGVTLYGRTGGDRRGPLTRSAMETIERGGTVDPEVRAILGELADHPSRVLRYSQADLNRIEGGLRGLAKSRRRNAGARPGEGRLGGPGDPIPARRGAGSGGGRTRRTIGDILLDEARAATTAGTSDDVRFKSERRDRIQRQIDALEARKDKSEKQKAELARLYGELGSVESELDAIADANEAAIEKQRDDAKRKREEARQKAQEERARRDQQIRDRIERREGRLTLAEELAGDTEKDPLDDKQALLRLRRFYGQQAQNDDLTLKERQEFAAKRRDVRRMLRDLNQQAVEDALEDDKLTKREQARLRQLGGAALVLEARRELKKAASTSTKGGAPHGKLTEARIRELQAEGLSAISQVFESYGSTLLAGGSGDMGQVATHAREQTVLMRAQNKILTQLTDGTRHPNVKYAQSEISAAAEVAAL